MVRARRRREMMSTFSCFCSFLSTPLPLLVPQSPPFLVLIFLDTLRGPLVYPGKYAFFLRDNNEDGPFSFAKGKGCLYYNASW